MISERGWRWITAVGVVAALVLVPAPLLPPPALVRFVQSALGAGASAAYLLAAIALQCAFFLTLGVVATRAVTKAEDARGRWLRRAVVPVVVVLAAFVIRSLKVGHLPVWVNVVVPLAACLAGTWIGLGLLHRRWQPVAAVVLAALVMAFFGLRGGVSDDLARETEARLQRLVAASAELPAGEERFGALLKVAFAPERADADVEEAIDGNRAAILALGIAIGHERLARRAGLDDASALPSRAAALRAGTTLREREDWPRHFCLSAALAVLEHPLVSDAGGLMKEELDALTNGTGFSFADLAADRAGVRFAEAATASEDAARALQRRLQGGYTAGDYFPPAADLPENLSVERFRLDYGGVGSRRYRDVVADIGRRLDACPGLDPRVPLR